MDYITSWIKEIILLIMMAVVLELLLPNSGFRRYVRMVVGLLLLLALLKPVLSVFDTNVNEMFSTFSQSPMVSSQQIKNSMKTKKKEIQASQHAYIEKQMAVRLKKQVEKEVSGRFHMDVADVSVTLKDVKFGQSPTNVKHVTVHLSKHKKGENITIKPVEPVTINVKKPQDDPSSDTGGKQEKIRSFLAGKWQVPQNKITVVLEGGGNNGP